MTKKEYVRTLLRLARTHGLERSIALLERERRKARAVIERLGPRVT
jgi:hypothetical protein